MHLAAGAYVCVEISDNGCGIEPDVLPRVFEPFFTTKRGGNHRGLGLAWVYGIVTNHGGGVAISSQPGVGTSVRVYLPAEKRVVRDHGLASDDLNGNQTVLMVDDEDLLLTMGQTILSLLRLPGAHGQRRAEGARNPGPEGPAGGPGDHGPGDARHERPGAGRAHPPAFRRRPASSARAAMSGRPARKTTAPTCKSPSPARNCCSKSKQALRAGPNGS